MQGKKNRVRTIGEISRLAGLAGNCLSKFLLLMMIVVIASPGIGRDLEKLQRDFLNLKFGMFIHFNMATFGPGGWANGLEDPLTFNPAELDMGQWADAAVSAHMKYAILTVKHTGGWCLWNSAYTDHDVAQFRNYRNGQADLVREFCEAFRERGIKVGLYYCFPLANSRWANYGTLPIKGYAEGKADAIGFIKNQFTELLSNYGDIDMIWIDQSKTMYGGIRPGDWLDFKNHVHQLQPNCLVIANNATDLVRSDVLASEYPYSLELPPKYNTTPWEVCDRLQNGWFTNNGKDAHPVRTVDYVVNRMLLPLNYSRANYLLNVAPNGKGLLPESVVQRLREIGEAWDPDIYHRTDKIIMEVPVAEKEISLVFDVEGEEDREFIEGSIRMLDRHEARGTIFVSRDRIAYMKDWIGGISDRGHETGLYRHMRSEDLDTLNGREIRAEIQNFKRELEGITHNTLVSFYNPGEYNEVLWNVLNYFEMKAFAPSLDAGERIPSGNKRDMQADIDLLLKELKPGSIVRIGKQTLRNEFLEPFLEALGEREYKIVPVSVLAGKEE